MTEEQRRPGWANVNAHVYRDEPADTIIHVRIRGDIHPADGPLLADMLKRFASAGWDRLFLLVDLSTLGNVSSEARKRMAEALIPVPITATATYGASFAQRVIATLADRTNNLVRGGKTYETRFFASEEQAREWLARKRAALAKGPGGPGSPRS